jgi:hypothetical protein
MIYELFHLCHEDWILQDNRTLPTYRLDDGHKWEVMVLTHIGQCQTCRAVHSRLAVNVDDAVQGTLAEKGTQDGFKRGIPIQNVVLKTIDGVQGNILVRILLFPPVRAKNVLGAVDDVRNPIGSGKPRR